MEAGEILPVRGEDLLEGGGPGTVGFQDEAMALFVLAQGIEGRAGSGWLGVERVIQGAAHRAWMLREEGASEADGCMLGGGDGVGEGVGEGLPGGFRGGNVGMEESFEMGGILLEDVLPGADGLLEGRELAGNGDSGGEVAGGEGEPAFLGLELGAEPGEGSGIGGGELGLRGFPGDAGLIEAGARGLEARLELAESGGQGQGVLFGAGEVALGVRELSAGIECGADANLPGGDLGGEGKEMGERLEGVLELADRGVESLRLGAEGGEFVGGLGEAGVGLGCLGGRFGEAGGCRLDPGIEETCLLEGGFGVGAGEAGGIEPDAGGVRVGVGGVEFLGEPGCGEGGLVGEGSGLLEMLEVAVEGGAQRASAAKHLGGVFETGAPRCGFGAGAFGLVVSGPGVGELGEETAVFVEPVEVGLGAGEVLAASGEGEAGSGAGLLGQFTFVRRERGLALEAEGEFLDVEAFGPIAVEGGDGESFEPLGTGQGLKDQGAVAVVGLEEGGEIILGEEDGAGELVEVEADLLLDGGEDLGLAAALEEGASGAIEDVAEVQGHFGALEGSFGTQAGSADMPAGGVGDGIHADEGDLGEAFGGAAAEEGCRVLRLDFAAGVGDGIAAGLGEPGGVLEEGEAEGVEDGALAGSGGAADGEQAGGRQGFGGEIDAVGSGERGEVAEPDAEDLHGWLGGWASEATSSRSARERVSDGSVPCRSRWAAAMRTMGSRESRLGWGVVAAGWVDGVPLALAVVGVASWKRVSRAARPCRAWSMRRRRVGSGASATMWSSRKGCGTVEPGTASGSRDNSSRITARLAAPDSGMRRSGTERGIGMGVTPASRPSRISTSRMRWL